MNRNIVDLAWKLADKHNSDPASEDLAAPRVRIAYTTGFIAMAFIAEQQLRATLEAHGCEWDEVEDIMHQWSKRIEALTGDEDKRVGNDDPRGYDKEGGKQ